MSTVFIPRPTSVVTVAGHPVNVNTGSTITLDETTEYVTASLELPLPADTVVDDIDPRDGARAVITARIGTGPARTFDVGVRERTIDHKKKTLTLSCASDEALLGDYAPLVDTVGAFAHQASLRSVINYVLWELGAYLEPGVDDAPMTVYSDARNMVPDPVVGILAIYTSTNCIRNFDVTWPGPTSGVNGVKLSAPTSADSFVSVDGDGGALRLGMTAGKTYTFSATGSVQTAVGGGANENARRIVVYHRVGTGPYLGTPSLALPTTVGASTRVSATVTLPAGTTEAFVRVFLGHTIGAVTWARFRLTEHDPRPGVDNTAFFSGDTADTHEYRYDWDGTVHASPSKRTALIDRAPELLHWLAGVSAWDFLMPLTSSSGLRLFCDEGRKWRLVPRSYMVPGAILANVGNTREGTDTITRDGDEWADGVVARFRWRGDDGTQLEASDHAGTAGKVLTFDFDRPYPGPGTAAFILNRMHGQGRSQEVVTVTNYTATPGMEARLTMPDTDQQTGRVTRVEFGLTEGFMVIGSRGLTDTPPEAWIMLAPGDAWLDSPAGGSWIGEVI